MSSSEQGVSQCAVCAWRGVCKLKYRYESSPTLHCREFTPDVSLNPGGSSEECSREEGEDVEEER